MEKLRKVSELPKSGYRPSGGCAAYLCFLQADFCTFNFFVLVNLTVLIVLLLDIDLYRQQADFCIFSFILLYTD